MKSAFPSIRLLATLVLATFHVLHAEPNSTTNKLVVTYKSTAQDPLSCS